MNKHEVVKAILGRKQTSKPVLSSGGAFAPANIALCKYWGKRDEKLNLPVTSSLSISLGSKGTTTEIKINESEHDSVIVNHQLIDLKSLFASRLIDFLNLFFEKRSFHFHIETKSNIPIAAGLASSASVFAALTMALNQLFGWNLSSSELSMLARLGSGSACRSLWNGFVEWQAGKREDGMDSFGYVLPQRWPEFCIGLLIISAEQKKISSREAMQCTVKTSPFYSLWPHKVDEDLILIKEAIHTYDIDLIGKRAESNAMAMHALMLSSWPPISYALPQTIQAMQKIWNLRERGLPLYFTQDAGPNLKLIFLEKEIDHVLKEFPDLEIIRPFKPE